MIDKITNDKEQIIIKENLTNKSSSYSLDSMAAEVVTEHTTVFSPDEEPIEKRRSSVTNNININNKNNNNNRNGIGTNSNTSLNDLNDLSDDDFSQVNTKK